MRTILTNSPEGKYTEKMQVTLFWFRRDLRLADNAGLYHALKENKNVLPIFIFDTDILDNLENKADKRVSFIYQTIKDLKQELENLGSSLLACYGKPKEILSQILDTYNITSVYANHDYEPYAKEREAEIASFLASKQIAFKTFKDQCIFEKGEVVKDDGKPYTIFTPYSRKWKAKINDFYLQSYPTEKYFANFQALQPLPLLSLAAMNFEETALNFPLKTVSDELIAKYSEKRDFPAIKGTSRLSVHLRFGTLSIRELARRGQQLSEHWLNELIWRDFYMMILWHFPQVVGNAFKPIYDRIVWRNNETEFQAWCEGKTGYPIVDAGMRELNETGFMHNRVRMIVASFLVKHLLIDWRWGEAYFAEKLLDFDLAANNGGWQWAASCGCDAVPYFRIFNPSAQAQKFDNQLLYIKKWIPEINSLQYPKPIVNHEFARARALETYKKGVGAGE
jgi:deoxyribodipyrimidine photo-lyase